MQLEQFKTDNGIELYIDTETGVSFASQSGYARMGSVALSTLRDRLSPMRKIDPETAKTLDVTDLSTWRNYIIQTVVDGRKVNLLSEDWIVDNLAVDNPKLLAQMTKLGVRATLHKWAGFEIKSEKKEPENVGDIGDIAIAAGNEIKRQQKVIIQLESELGNAKQKVKDNLEKFKEYFDENITLEENVDKFGKMIIEYKQQIMQLEYQFENYKENSKDNVNHFFWENRNICTMSEGERRAFGRLITKICNRYNFNFDEKTNVKNGQDLNVNHYPLSLLNRIFNLVNGGHNYAYIIEQFADLDV